MRRRWHRMAAEVRREIIGLAAGGATYGQILERVDVSVGSITNVLRPLGGVIRREHWEPSSDWRLSADQRVEIALGIERGWSFRKIARALGRAPSTISREVGGVDGRGSYLPLAAHRDAARRARRPKPAKLAANPRLCRRVSDDLRKLWSPQQISARLAVEFDNDPNMNVSHETIYQSIYVQGRGALRKELAACLRTGRARRRPQGRLEKRPKLRDMVMISQRPAEVADRAVPGHWEGDLIMGTGNRSAIGTLVERTSRFVMFLHLPNGHGAEAVRTAMTAKIRTLPAALRRSITWDQGSEMAEHVQFRVDTGVDIFFCDPHAPWLRGSNENTNGLARQYFPKGTDLSIYSATDLDTAADSLNGRPRQTLGWRTPSEKLAEIVASTG
jgi:IS30 family transposase